MRERVVIASVREPLRRLQSHFYYYMYRRRNFTGVHQGIAIPEAHMEFDAWYLRHHGSAWFRCPQTYCEHSPMHNYMSHYLGFSRDTEVITASTLRNRFTQILIAERLNESLRILAASLGVPADASPPVRHVNRNPRRVQSPSVGALFDAHNKRDQHLYKVSGEMLDADLARGIHDAQVR